MGGIADPEALAAEAAPRPGGPQALPAKAGSRPGTPVPGAQRSVRARPPSFVPPPQRPPRRRSRSAARRIAGTPNRSTHPTGDPRPPSPARSEASAPVPSSPVPPPQRPPRRRSRSAARRIAGTLSRSRQPTGDPRPPSNVPGKVQEGAKASSWFPPPAERTQIIFPGGTHGGKNPSHGATCETGPAPRGWTRFAPKRSAKPLRQYRRGFGHRPAAQEAAGRGTREEAASAASSRALIGKAAPPLYR